MIEEVHEARDRINGTGPEKPACDLGAREVRVLGVARPAPALEVGGRDVRVRDAARRPGALVVRVLDVPRLPDAVLGVVPGLRLLDLQFGSGSGCRAHKKRDGEEGASHGDLYVADG